MNTNKNVMAVRRQAGNAAFTLIEVMVVVVLLAFIIIALMGVFNSTQAAFRASVTQTDVLESGRAAMDLITTDLRAMAPSFGVSNSSPLLLKNGLIPVNFSVAGSGSPPLVQSLVASSGTRTNVLESLFMLRRENQTWTGVGYYVDTASTIGVNSFYRFSMSTNVSAVNGAAMLYANFLNTPLTNSPPWSHVMDGVLTLKVRAYDTNGVWLNWQNFNLTNVGGRNIVYYQPQPGESETSFIMFSNTLPATVEIEMATLEDRTLQRAESRPSNLPLPSPGDARTKYLQDQASKVHIFRQRVAIPNVDPTVYQ